MNTMFVRFNSFHIFDALKFILHHSHLLFNFLVLSHSYYNFYCEKSSTKRLVVPSFCWPQWGRQTYSWKYSVLLSLSHNSTVANQYFVWTIRKHDLFSTFPVISLLVSAFSFVHMTRCLYLSWSLWSYNNHVTYS